MFGGRQTPCVGVSIGVERIFSLLEAKNAAEGFKVRTAQVEVFVASAHKGLIEKRLEIVSLLWDNGIKVINNDSFLTFIENITLLLYF